MHINGTTSGWGFKKTSDIILLLKWFCCQVFFVKVNLKSRQEFWLMLTYLYDFFALQLMTVYLEVTRISTIANI